MSRDFENLTSPDAAAAYCEALAKLTHLNVLRKLYPGVEEQLPSSPLEAYHRGRLDQKLTDEAGTQVTSMDAASEAEA